MENPQRICRFCFKKCDTNFKVVERSTHEILNMLLVTMNLAISDEPVMCTNCSDILQNCFVFKKTCLNTRDHAVASGNHKDNGHTVCEFCMNLLKNCSFAILDVDEDIREKTILEKYLPELNLSASKKPKICEVCHGSLMNFLSFITMSSVVEEKIKEYCKAEGVNNTVPIKLNRVLQFTTGNVYKRNHNELDVFKMEEMVSLKSENETINVQGVCALCLETRDNFKAIDGNMKNFLDILLSKIDFTAIEGSVMCRNCEEMLIKCFDFKAMCLHTQEYIVSFVNNSDDVQPNLKDVYRNKNITGTDVLEDQNVCGFCMGLVENCSAIFLDVVEGDVMLKKMIEQCLPELDLSGIKKSVICASCHGTLEDCFNFVKNCLIIREKTKEYCETPDINSNGQIELSSSLPFTMTNMTTWGVDGNSGDTIKIEKEFCEGRRNPDERVIANGGDRFTLDQIKENDKLSFIKTEEIFCKKNETKHKEENLIKMEDQQFLLKEEIEIKTVDINRIEDIAVLPQLKVIRTNQRDPCSFQTKFKSDLGRHLMKHKDPVEVTKHKCDFCSFQTKHKFNLKTHLLTHKDPSEVTLYNCDSCAFQTKRKHDLKIHLLNHKDSSEVTMYKCPSCLYQTKRKNHLKIHSLTHRDPSEVTMYKCDTCVFQTKRKSDLKKHSLIHKDPSEVIVYKCVSCSFHTKYKSSINIHLLKHKDPSEVTMYGCDSCSYQTKSKDDLKKHLLIHKDPSEVTMYKCDTCLFQTKIKRSLSVHLLKHKNASKVGNNPTNTSSNML